MVRIVLLLSAVLALVAGRQSEPSAAASPRVLSSDPQMSNSELQALALLEPIDAHTHVAKGDPSFYALLQRLHMHIVDILLVDTHDDYRKALEPQLQDALRVVRESKGYAALCTTFDPYQFGQPGFPGSAIQRLDRDFADGAVAVKIWKNIGMDLKDPNGHYVLPDNPVFQPIFKEIQAHNRTLIAHLAEPDEAWQPPNPQALDYSYYEQNPVWYMYRKPEAPNKQQILEARDHLLARNPKLRVIGAHLGSMEDDLDLLAKHLNQYPNFAVDTAARVPHLVVQPSDKVSRFILKYQDRILYATDLEFLNAEEPQVTVKDWEQQYALDWRYFATKEVFEYSDHKVQGLGLPQAVLRKLYHANAVHWIPNVIGKQ